MPNEEMALEQDYVSMLYRRLDDLRERASGRLSGVLRQTGGTHQARTEREVFSVMYGSSWPSSTRPSTGLCSAGSNSTRRAPLYRPARHSQ